MKTQRLREKPQKEIVEQIEGRRIKILVIIKKRATKNKINLEKLEKWPTEKQEQQKKILNKQKKFWNIKRSWKRLKTDVERKKQFEKQKKKLKTICKTSA